MHGIRECGLRVVGVSSGVARLAGLGFPGERTAGACAAGATAVDASVDFALRMSRRCPMLLLPLLLLPLLLLPLLLLRVKCDIFSLFPSPRGILYFLFSVTLRI